jgi:hypothetical protein
MNLEMHNTIAATHLQRQAYLYVRVQVAPRPLPLE